LKISKNKTTSSLIALFLMLTIAASLVALPTVNAQNSPPGVPEWTTYIFVASSPVTGVGEEMFIIYCVDRMPQDVGEQFNAVPSSTGRAGWDGITLTITAPDDTVQVFTMPRTDPVGGGYYLYTPTQIGEYSVVAAFPGEWKNASLPGYTFTLWAHPCTSNPATFTVQEEPVARWPEAPLPDNYWMRPIPGPAHTWSALAANWLGSFANVWPVASSGGNTGSYSYGTAPESAHILWTRQFYPTGSIADSRFDSNVYTLSHYEGVDYSAVILDGQMHMMPAWSAHAEDQFGGWETWDLYTGEKIAYRPDVSNPAFGTIYYYDSGNQHGCFDYLWRTSKVVLPEVVRLANATANNPIKQQPLLLGTNYLLNTSTLSSSAYRSLVGTLWQMLDGYTGNPLCYIANVSSGTQVYGSDGSIDYYSAVNLGTTANPKYYLRLWNSSHGTMPAATTGSSAWQWRPSGMNRYSNLTVFFGPISTNAVHDGNLMYTLNVSIPSLLGTRNAIENQTMSIRAVREGEYVIFGTTGSNDERGIVPAEFMAVSLKLGEEGTLLWTSSITVPKDNSIDYGPVTFRALIPESNVAYYESDDQLMYWFFDLKTGQQLWDCDMPEQFAYYGVQDRVYNGTTVILGGSYAGVLRAYDIRTGELLWTIEGNYAGTESPYGRELLSGMTIADGKLYTGTGEHSPSSPLWRTEGIQCWNITTGEKIWGILFWAGGMGGGAPYLSDGILTGWNIYDGQVYAFGKGPSGTTVTASPEVSVYGSSVLVKGTVTDQTPTGRRNVNNELQFALKDTPAIADEDMTAWMEYLFMGQAFPADAKGVEVTLTVLDPNSNVYEIGKTTSDVKGAFGYAFTPEVPGTYQIIAAFKGSASYYGSSASTYITVEEAPAPTPAPTPTPAPMTDTYVMGFGIGMIIAIVAVGLLLFLLLRKR
jgi:outer membrane protein assembly factor BamB